MCCLFEHKAVFDEDIFDIEKIYLYKVYLANSKVQHDKGLVRKLVTCKNCGSLFVEQITDKDNRYIEVKSEKIADKLARSLKDNAFESDKHNMIIVEKTGNQKTIIFRKGK